MVALDPRWKNADPKQMLAHAVREQMDLKRDRYYQLDGDCYAVALEARKKQFPYYIDDVFYVSRFKSNDYGKESKSFTGGPDDPLADEMAAFGSITDAGYVKAKYIRPEGVEEGYNDKTIDGTGKMNADQINYQNWAHNQAKPKYGKPALRRFGGVG